MKTKANNLTQKLVVSALLIAVATVLSEIKPFPQVMGGGITALSMLPIVLIPIMYGTRWGCFSCGIYAVIQLLFGIDSALYAPTPIGVVGSLLLDYFFAYFALSICGFFAKGNKIMTTIGVAVAIIARYFVNTLASCVVWGDMLGDFWGSLWVGITYNLYILVEGAAVVAVVAILLQNKSFLKIIGR